MPYDRLPTAETPLLIEGLLLSGASLDSAIEIDSFGCGKESRTVAEDWLNRISVEDLDEIARRRRSPGRSVATVAKTTKSAVVTKKMSAKAGVGANIKVRVNRASRTAARGRRGHLVMEGTSGRSINVDSGNLGSVDGGSADRSTAGRGARKTAGLTNRSSVSTKVKREIRDLICGHTRKYDQHRKELESLVTHTASGIVTYIATSIAPHVGLAAAVLMPFVAQVLSAVLKVGKEVYCAD